MTSRVSFFKLMINDIKRRIWVPSVLLLMYIITGPVLLLIKAENTRLFSYGNDYLEIMADSFKPDALTMIPTVIIASVLLAVSGFAFLFSKKKVDLYHSLPIKREKIFLVEYVSGLVVYVLLIALKLVAIIAIASSGRYLTSTAMTNIINTFWGEIFIFIFMYNVNILAVMLTGQIIVAMLAIGVLNGFYPAMVELFNFLSAYNFVTYHENIKLYEKYPYLSPLMVLFAFVKADTYQEFPIKSIPVMLLISTVVATCVLALALYLYKIRPSESCQKAIAFEKSKPFIRIPLVFLGGLMGIAQVSANANKHMSVWIYVGLVFGVLIVHCAIECIFNYDFKAAFNNYKQMLICLLAVAVVFVIYSKDVFGYDKYVPAKDKIVEATISIPGLDSDLSCIAIKDMNENKEADIRYMSLEEYMRSHMFTDKDMIDSIYDFSQLGVTFVDKMKENMHSSGDNGRYYDAKEAVVVGQDDIIKSVPVESLEIHEDDPYSYRENGFTVYYKLKSGREIARYYTGDKDEVTKLIGELYSKDAYKKVHYGVYECADMGAISSVEVVDTFSERQMSVVGKETAEFMQVYLADLENATIEDLKGLPIASVSPKIKTKDQYNETLSGYYIYPSFRRTISYMERYGVNMEGMTIYPDADKVESISVSAYNYVFDKDSDVSHSMNGLMYLAEDPAGKKMIDELCSKVKLYNFGWSNSELISKEDRVELMIYYNIQGGIQKCSTAYFEKGDIPNELKNDILKYTAEHMNEY